MTTFGVIEAKTASALNPLCQHNPRYPRIIIHKAHVVPAHEQLLQRSPLPVSDFHGEQATGTQSGVRLGNQALVDGESVIACKESAVRLMLHHFDLHCR